MPIRASSAMTPATPSSTPRWDGPVPPASSMLSLMRFLRPRSRRAAAQLVLLVALGHETGRLHQPFMLLLGVGDPLGVRVAGHEGLVEGAVAHQLLPLRRLTHLLEQVNV